jgi:CheY-like chemotaxis protein
LTHAPDRGARVLLVDDEPDQIEMYRFALEDAGYAVIAAEDGHTAVRLARAEAPDVIVLDIRLPDISGWEVCRLLRSDSATERIPIVVLTAVATQSLADDAARWGCAAHLLKPCYPVDLARTIDAVLRTVPPQFGV